MRKAPSFECTVGHLAKDNLAVEFYCFRPSPTVTEALARHSWARWLKEASKSHVSRVILVCPLWSFTLEKAAFLKTLLLVVSQSPVAQLLRLPLLDHNSHL